VTGRVRPEGKGWRLEMVARRGSARQRRALWHRECEVLGEAAALLIALAIDPGAAAVDPGMASLLREAKAQPPRESRPATRVAPTLREPLTALSVPSDHGSAERPAEVGAEAGDGEEPVLEDVAHQGSPAIATKRRIERWVGIRAAGGLAYGLRSALSGGFIGTAAMAVGRFARIEAAGSYWRLGDERDGGQERAGADLTLAAGSLRGCGVPRRGVVEVPLCAGVTLGSLRVTGPGIPQGRGEGQLWSAVSLGAALALVPIPQLAIWLAVDGDLALTRPSFRIAPVGEDWRAGPV
jgi:hypothetical protein